MFVYAKCVMNTTIIGDEATYVPILLGCLCLTSESRTNLNALDRMFSQACFVDIIMSNGALCHL